MIELADRTVCTGSMACANVCSLNAISVKYDEQGFIYPEVDNALCRLCGKCVNVCAALQGASELKEPIGFWAGWTKDKVMQKKSTSGGLFMSLCRYVFSLDGVVFGARFDEQLKVFHGVAYNEQQAGSMHGSKYIQSNVADSYRKAGELLKEGKTVLFTGTPCQIDGLYKVLNGDHDNLITCEVLCHGVGSTRYFEDVIADLESEYKSKAINVKFRHKLRGWEDSCFSITFENGKRFLAPSYYNAFGYPFSLGHICRESCFSCGYSAPNRVADITLGDYSAKDKEKYTKAQKDLGISLILASTDKGKKVLEGMCDSLVLDPKPIQQVAVSNPALKPRNKDKTVRSEFFSLYAEKGFHAVKMRYGMPDKKTVFRFKHRRQIAFIYNLLKKLHLK